jgi:hypothetical protein
MGHNAFDDILPVQVTVQPKWSGKFGPLVVAWKRADSLFAPRLCPAVGISCPPALRQLASLMVVGPGAKSSLAHTSDNHAVDMDEQRQHF